jgi:hypothetical protein
MMITVDISAQEWEQQQLTLQPLQVTNSSTSTSTSTSSMKRGLFITD